MHVDISSLASLARLLISPEEASQLEKEIPAILSFVETITAVAADAGAPAAREVRNVMRDDVVQHDSGVHTENLLSAAPAREGQYIKVKQVITKGKYTQE
jgi:aspartyl-tRNA(Asn)/glutamyl-tRNA(Gln) amidotransferase subunit C